MVRVKDDSGGYPKMLLDPYNEELSLLESTARAVDWEREIAIQLMGRCGLRADEVRYPTRDRLRWSSSGECWFVEVKGKDTSGGGGKIRDVWVPEPVAENIQRFASDRDLAGTEPVVSVSTPSVRRWVSETAEQLAEDGYGERWYDVSSHDLRRSWATYYIVEVGVDVRTMMAIGGWSDYAAVEPYLGEPTEAKIGRTLPE
jgi:integrase